MACERGDSTVVALLEEASRRGVPVMTSSGCVAQAWRSGGPRQALLVRTLRGVDEQALDRGASRVVGGLLAQSGTSDVVDAHVAVLATGGMIVTSDQTDLRRLLDAGGIEAEIEPC